MAIPSKIDVVISWVDGSDPAHAEKRSVTMSKMGLPFDPRSTRYSDMGEIYYCIASILKYAPFIDRIYLITDEQKPRFLDLFTREGICSEGKIQVVDHSVIFNGFEDCLPTFNPRPIETMMWRIPGIAEHFIFLNDDFFLNSEVYREDLINSEGKLVLHGRIRKTWPLRLKHRFRSLVYRLLKKGNLPPSHNIAQAKSAAIAGLDYYLQVEHTPHILRTSTFDNFFRKHRALIKEQVCKPFRSISQFHPVSLANSLEIKEGNAEIKPPEPCIYMKPTTPEKDARSIDHILREKYKYGCIQSMDQFSQERIRIVRNIMNQKFEGYLPTGIDLPDSQ